MFFPIQSWTENFLSARFDTSDSISGTQQSAAAVDRVKFFLSSLTHWNLLSLHSMVLDCKSLLIGMALFHERLSVYDALMASRLEEETQIEEWGRVEGGHDIDTSTIYMKLIAASVFLKLLKH